eukprot:2027924-Pleurochrysis_carterae.AAC.3
MVAARSYVASPLLAGLAGLPRLALTYLTAVSEAEGNSDQTRSVLSEKRIRAIIDVFELQCMLLKVLGPRRAFGVILAVINNCDINQPSRALPCDFDPENTLLHGKARRNLPVRLPSPYSIRYVAYCVPGY